MVAGVSLGSWPGKIQAIQVSRTCSRTCLLRKEPPLTQTLPASANRQSKVDRSLPNNHQTTNPESTDNRSHVFKKAPQRPPMLARIKFNYHMQVFRSRPCNYQKTPEVSNTQKRVLHIPVKGSKGTSFVILGNCRQETNGWRTSWSKVPPALHNGIPTRTRAMRRSSNGSMNRRNALVRAGFPKKMSQSGRTRRFASFKFPRTQGQVWKTRLGEGGFPGFLFRKIPGLRGNRIRNGPS